MASKTASQWRLPLPAGSTSKTKTVVKSLKNHVALPNRHGADQQLSLHRDHANAHTLVARIVVHRDRRIISTSIHSHHDSRVGTRAAYDLPGLWSLHIPCRKPPPRDPARSCSPHNASEATLPAQQFDAGRAWSAPRAGPACARRCWLMASAHKLWGVGLGSGLDIHGSPGRFAVHNFNICPHDPRTVIQIARSGQHCVSFETPCPIDLDVTQLPRSDSDREPAQPFRTCYDLTRVAANGLVG